jgi:hypothetical protein
LLQICERYTASFSEEQRQGLLQMVGQEIHRKLEEQQSKQEVQEKALLLFLSQPKHIALLKKRDLWTALALQKQLTDRDRQTIENYWDAVAKNPHLEVQSRTMLNQLIDRLLALLSSSLLRKDEDIWQAFKDYCRQTEDFLQSKKTEWEQSGHHYVVWKGTLILPPTIDRLRRQYIDGLISAQRRKTEDLFLSFRKEQSQKALERCRSYLTEAQEELARLSGNESEEEIASAQRLVSIGEETCRQAQGGVNWCIAQQRKSDQIIAALEGAKPKETLWENVFFTLSAMTSSRSCASTVEEEVTLLYERESLWTRCLQAIYKNHL